MTIPFRVSPRASRSYVCALLCCSSCRQKRKTVFFWGGKFQERRRVLFFVFNCNYWYQDIIYFCVWVCSLIYFKFQPDFWTVNHEALDMCTQKCLQETGWCCSYVFFTFLMKCFLFWPSFCVLLAGVWKLVGLQFYIVRSLVFEEFLTCSHEEDMRSQDGSTIATRRSINYRHHLQKKVSSNSWMDAFHSCADGRHWFYL